MRSLHADLTAAQQSRYAPKPAVKIVLTYGETTYTLQEDRIKNLQPYESLWHYYAKEVKLNNLDGYFYDIDLKGYQAVLHRGYYTKSGAKYSYGAPLKVVWQEFDDTPGKQTCVLKLLGIPDLMDLDEANDDYIPASDDATTVKELLTAIAGATLDCYDHCTAYTIEWDNDENDDNLLNFTPADSFRIYQKVSRLAAFRRVLEYCACGARFEDDGKIHILMPTTTGEVYDYEHSLPNTHPFFSKAYRDSLVIPNKFVVENQKDDVDQYSGSATHAASYAILPKVKYFRTRLSSNDEAAAIAQALQDRATWEAEQGVADAMMNCGAEIFDYVKVGAYTSDDSARTGNIGWLQWRYIPDKSIYDYRFGFGAPPLSRHTKELYRQLESETGTYFEKLFAKDIYLLDEITIDDLPDGEEYTRTHSLHLDATGVFIESDTIYYLRLPGQAVARVWKGTSAIASPVEGDLWLDTNDTPNVVKRYNGAEWQELPAASIADLEKGIIVRELKQAALTPDGLVLVSELYGGLADMSGNLGDIADGGGFAKLYSTDVAAGHVLLSAYTQVSGQWYAHSGVMINANYGIRLYGGQVAFSTHPTYSDAYNNTNIQCYVGTDGKLYAGAGKVILDASGAEFRDQAAINFTYYGSYAANFGVDYFGNLQIGAYSGKYVNFQSNVQAGLDLIVGTLRLQSGIAGGLILNTLGKAEEGSFRMQGGGGNDLYVYSSGAWRTNG